MITCLIEAGASVDKVDNAGAMPLYYAVESGEKPHANLPLCKEVTVTYICFMNLVSV